jgi:TolA-binding protein
VGTPVRPVEGDVISQALAWVRTNRRTVTTAAAVLAVIAGGIWFVLSARARKEAFAASALRDAQIAIQAGNAPLATSDLSRLVSAYQGTAAAAEGAIVLGQLRLTRGEADSAIRELRGFTESHPRPRFAAAAYNLLGEALEQKRRMAEAGEAYAQAAAAWPYDYLKAQSLLDAGRPFRAAGDTVRAVQSYQQVVRDHAKSPAAVEAHLRLGELGAPEASKS